MPWIVQKAQTVYNYFRSNPSAKRKLYVTAALVALISLALQYYHAQKKRKHYLQVKKKLEHEKSKRGTAAHTGHDGKSKPSRVAVDAIFFKRLAKILKIAVPGVASAEFADIMILTLLLVSRTMFSIYIAELVGLNAQSMVSRRWNRLFRGIGLFAMITIPAAAINSGLKYFQEIIALRFRVRLSEYVHDEYLEGVNFYKASNLSTSDGGRIENADQRVTADIANFSDEIAKLYASSAKPLLDVILFTYKLGTIVGWQGPACMHLYFAFSAFIKKRIMPNLGKLVARESELEGYYRTAHNRVITNSEEIAFYNGASKEKTIINNALHQIYEHVSFHRYVRALIGVFDQLLIKYYASIAGYVTLTAPLVFNINDSRRLTSQELTRDYIRNSQYLGNLSTAVSDLIVVGNKLVSIAGYTSRVSELLEQVKLLKGTGNKPFTIKENVDSAGNGNGNTSGDDDFGKPPRKESLHQLDGVDDWVKQWKVRCDDQQEERYKIRESMDQSPVIGGGIVKYGSYIEFKNVDIVSPEGKLLVKQLNFRVDPGVNVMITGYVSSFQSHVAEADADADVPSTTGVYMF
jgi:ATP-binding cassette subfamily D (ALD) protein 3